MNWKTLIAELNDAGMSQASIGAEIGKSQAWVCAVLAEQYADLKWADGEALLKLHAVKLGSSNTAAQKEAA